MKKLFLALVAFAAAAMATSCTNDLITEGPLEGESIVSFTVNTPEVASRAFGDGETAGDLYYAVYLWDKQGNYKLVETISKTEAKDKVAIPISTTVDLRLFNGNTYSILFWAENEAGVATIAWEDMKMTFDPKKANVEEYDAFWAYVKPFKVEGRIDQNVDLYRPFAQVNVGTADYADAVAAGTTITTSGIEVTLYTELDLVNGTASNPVALTYAAEPIPADTEKFPVAGYKYLAMNYVLVNDAKELVEVKFNYYDNNNVDYQRVYTNVPVRRNYRTNIYGNILTDAANYTVTIVPGFDDDIEAIDYDVFHAFQYGGEVTLQEDFVIPSTLVVKKGQNVVLNLNGHSIVNEIDNPATDVIVVEEDATLTINGNGTIEAVSGNDGYAVIAEGKLVINGGTYKAGVDQNGEANAVVYARGNGEVYVNGGTFLNDHNSNFVLNKKDADRATTVIEVAGGIFHNFNPADNAAEGAGTNFVKDGLSSIEIQPNVWEVKYVVDFVDMGTYAEVYTANGLLKWAYKAQADETYGVKLMANIVMPQFAIVEDAANNTYAFTNEAITVIDGVPSASNWPIISAYETANSKYYSGVIDGNNMTISGLRLNHDLVASGFLCWTQGAKVDNLTFDNAVVYNKGGNAGESYTGIVIGRCWDGSHVNNVHVTASSVKGYTEVGGIVGRVYHRTVKADGTVMGEDMAYVTYCSTDENTTVKGDANVGGIVGMNYGCVVGQCENNADVTARTQAGGIAGAHQSYNTKADAFMLACRTTAKATVKATAGYAGAFAGYTRRDQNHAHTRVWIVGCASESTVEAADGGTMVGYCLKNHGVYGNGLTANYAVTTKTNFAAKGNPEIEASYNFAAATDATQADVDAMNAAIEAFNVSPDNEYVNGTAGAEMLKRWVLGANGPVLQ